MTKDGKVQTSRALYISGYNMDEIATIMEVSKRTVQNYKSEDTNDWDELRAAKYIGSDKDHELLHKNFFGYMDATLREIRKSEDLSSSERVDKIAKLADSVLKMQKVAGCEDPETYKHGLIKATIVHLVTWLTQAGMSSECLDLLANTLHDKQKQLSDVSAR